MKILVLAPVAAIITIAAVIAASTTPASVRTWLVPTVIGICIAGSGLATAILRTRRERRLRTSSAESVESIVAAQSQAGAFRDSLLVLALALLVAAIFPSVPAIVIVFGALLAVLVDFWIRYGFALRGLASQ